jgi:hypothetical protein
MPSLPASFFGPPRVGKHILSRQKQVAKMWWVNEKRCKDSGIIHATLDAPQDAVLFVRRNKLPEDVTIWFALAGEHSLFENDLSQFCHTVVFCDHLRVEGEDGEHRWIKGFNTTSSDKITKTEVKALLGDKLFRHARRVMFVNLSGPPPQDSPAYSSSLFLHMISVLGHLKVNALLLEGGASVRSLSHAARAFYASAYERRAALGLRAECYRQTLSCEPGIGEMASAMVGSIEQEWIPEVNAQMKSAYSSMPQTEKRVLMLDPTVSPQNVKPYDRFVVELI